MSVGGGGIDFRMGYEEIQAMAHIYDQSADNYQRIRQALARVSNSLTSQNFVGHTGQAAAVFIQDLDQRLQEMIQKCNELQQALLATQRQVTGEVEPNMVALYRKGN